MPTLSANCFWDNPQPNTQVVGVGGTITDDPLFVNIGAGDYRLASGSPCIDRGNDAYALSTGTDLAGNPRITGAHVDIGAYEFTTAPPTGLYSMSDVVRAMRLAAGLTPSDPYNPDRLDVVKTTAPRVDILDAIRLARIVAGLDANP